MYLIDYAQGWKCRPFCGLSYYCSEQQKKEEKVCFKCELSWILQGQIIFTVGIPCFQGDGRLIRYLTSLGFRPPISKISPEEEFGKLKNNDCVRVLSLVGFFCCLRLNHR